MADGLLCTVIRQPIGKQVPPSASYNAASRWPYRGITRMGWRACGRAATPRPIHQSYRTDRSFDSLSHPGVTRPGRVAIRLATPTTGPTQPSGSTHRLLHMGLRHPAIITASFNPLRQRKLGGNFVKKLAHLALLLLLLLLL